MLRRGSEEVETFQKRSGVVRGDSNLTERQDSQGLRAETLEPDCLAVCEPRLCDSCVTMGR